MNFALLWIDALVVSLLWTATATAFVGRVPRRWIRRLLLVVTSGVPLLLLGGFVFASGVAKATRVEPNWLGCSELLLAAYLIGAGLILRRSCRPAIWSRGPLAFAFVMALAVGYMTLMNMDLVIRARCAIESVQVSSRYLAALPSLTSYSQNAAPLYEKSFALLAADPPTDVKNPPTGANEKFDPNEPATISFLARQSGTIDLLHRAASLPACRFDRDLSDPDVTSMVADLNQDRQAANVLNLHAREELAHGHMSSAILDADAILKMSRQIGQRPMIISGLVGIGIAAMGDRTLEQALPAVSSKAELAGLHIEDLDPMGRVFQQSLRGEEMFGLNIFGNMPPNPEYFTVDGTYKNPEMMATANGGPLGAFSRVFFLNPDGYVRLMDKLQELSTQPYYKARQPLDDACAPNSDSGILTSILAPSLAHNFYVLARIEADDACTQTAVAMTRYRLDHGSLPKNLPDLVPTYIQAVPVDLFDGKPLRLVFKEDRCVIYGVGSDLVDHGGVEGNGRKPGDVVFTLTIAKPH